VGVRQEGSTRAVLLALPSKPHKGDMVRLVSSRVVRDPVVGGSGYAESYVERPTRRLALKVLFPRSRPPSEARLVVSPSDTSRTLRVRYGRDGRPFLSYSLTNPKLFARYSLRWLW
jgi:hypothetical protein